MFSEQCCCEFTCQLIHGTKMTVFYVDVYAKHGRKMFWRSVYHFASRLRFAVYMQDTNY